MTVEAHDDPLSVADTKAHKVATEALAEGDWVFGGIVCTRDEIAHAIVSRLAEAGMLTSESTGGSNGRSRDEP